MPISVSNVAQRASILKRKSYQSETRWKHERTMLRSRYGNEGSMYIERHNYSRELGSASIGNTPIFSMFRWCSKVLGWDSIYRPFPSGSVPHTKKRRWTLPSNVDCNMGNKGRPKSYHFVTLTTPSSFHFFSRESWQSSWPSPLHAVDQ